VRPCGPASLRRWAALAVSSRWTRPHRAAGKASASTRRLPQQKMVVTLVERGRVGPLIPYRRPFHRRHRADRSREIQRETRDDDRQGAPLHASRQGICGAWPRRSRRLTNGARGDSIRNTLRATTALQSGMKGVYSIAAEASLSTNFNSRTLPPPFANRMHTCSSTRVGRRDRCSDLPWAQQVRENLPQSWWPPEANRAGLMANKLPLTVGALSMEVRPFLRIPTT